MSEGRERGREKIGTGRGRRKGGEGWREGGGMEKGRKGEEWRREEDGEREKRGGRERKAKEVRDILVRNWEGKTLPQLTNSNSEIIKTEKYDPNNN